jgi:ATP-dependent DNA helicase DinG
MKNMELFFPFKKIRNSQRDALNKLSEELIDNNKKFFIVDAETGVGKSAIGIAAANYLNSFIGNETDISNQYVFSNQYIPGCYFLTTQKILQDQYIKDFEITQGMVNIKSSNNYECQNKKIGNITCAEGLRIANANMTNNTFNGCIGNCVYKKQKNDFINSRLGITNYSYFLAETYYSKKIKPKRVLILDEAHNLVSELGKFVEIIFSEKFAKSELGLDLPEKITQSSAFNWIKNEYTPKAADRLEKIKSDIDRLLGPNSSEKIKEFESLANKIEILDKHVCKVNRFVENYKSENWTFNFVEGNVTVSSKLEFKPIDVSFYAKTMLFDRADKIILMSATVVCKDNFCNLLGIDQNDCGYIHIKSPFKLENKPVIYLPAGKMSMKGIDETLPKLANLVKELLKIHKNEKGIIHAGSYKIANYLAKNINSKRLLIHDSSNRDQTLQLHSESDKPTVLVSPSMQEGIDLKDDLSRFQIICKIPYPYLGDKLVTKRMHKWNWWYDYETAKTIIQSIGRSIRNENDHAVTYILDEDWLRFYSKNKHLLPENLVNFIKG